MNQQWKAAERAICKILGAVRVPVPGRARGSAPDGLHPRWSIEIKHGAFLPAWLNEAMAQADASAQPGQVPIAVLHPKGTPYPDSLVMVRLRDFVNIAK